MKIYLSCIFIAFSTFGWWQNFQIFYFTYLFKIFRRQLRDSFERDRKRREEKKKARPGFRKSPSCSFSERAIRTG
jgi:hypothetical protein